MGLKQLNFIRHQEDNESNKSEQSWLPHKTSTKLAAKGSGDRGGPRMPSGAKEVAETDPLPVLNCP